MINEELLIRHDKWQSFWFKWKEMKFFMAYNNSVTSFKSLLIFKGVYLTHQPNETDPTQPDTWVGPGSGW